MDHIGSVWISSTDGIQIDTCSNDLTAVMIHMVANDLRTARSSKKLCLVMMIFLLEIYSKIGITGAAFLCFTIDFFSTSAAGILIVPIFSSSCYIVYTPDPEEPEKIFRSVTLHVLLL